MADRRAVYAKCFGQVRLGEASIHPRSANPGGKCIDIHIIPPIRDTARSRRGWILRKYERLVKSCEDVTLLMRSRRGIR